MVTSEARIIANQANAAKSCGPKTVEGKEQSRQNWLKHGLTGAGVVLPPEDSVEVEQRYQAFRDELQPSSSLGLTLVRRAAVLAVRMEKCSERDLAATAERMTRAIVDFEAPEGADAAEVARLRAEAGRIAAFDTSKEACLARRYEAAAERGFYRALKELRLVEKQVKAVAPDPHDDLFDQEMGSFLQRGSLDAERDALDPEPALPAPRNLVGSAVSAPQFIENGRVDVPFTIGRAR